jgi:hypothetical protein
MWWLLAPVLFTVLGASILQWREHRMNAPRRGDPIEQHQALLAALATLEGPATLEGKAVRTPSASPDPEH